MSVAGTFDEMPIQSSAIYARTGYILSALDSPQHHNTPTLIDVQNVTTYHPHRLE